MAAEYEGALSVIEHEKNMLDEFVSQSEAQAWLVSDKYYNALIKNENSTIAKLKEEKQALLSQLQEGMTADGKPIKKYSQAWYEMVNAIDEVTLSIEQSETAILEYQQTIQQLKWEVFDLIQDKISSITEETDFLIELMSNSKLHEDSGQLTNKGTSTMGMHGVNYNVYMRQADDARIEAERLKKELEADPYDTELEKRYREMIALQQERILAAEGEKEAIRDLVEEGIELELDALQERIDKYNESIDAAKDLYDYQKRVKEQTEEIASLEKQMAAYAGDDSEEAKSKVQELKVSLEEAKSDLEETEYDRYISDQQKLLDDLYLEYETVLNTRLDNIEVLISDMISAINTNSNSISDTLREIAKAAGYNLSDSMETILEKDSNKNMVTNYGENFATAQTTTGSALNAINTSVKNMVNTLDTKANTKVNTAATSSAAKAPAAKPTTPATPKTEPATPTQKDYNGVALAIINGNHDWGTGQERKKKLAEAGLDAEKVQDAVNKLWNDSSVHNGSWSKKYGISDLTQYSYKNYESGVAKINKEQLAWTQENGKKEMIIRPSDGAILTPLAKNDSVLNAVASKNLWNMANSPSDFIKDNLNLGIANVPNNSNTHNTYTQHLENVVFSLPNVKNYEELLSAMQKDKNFERLILSMSIDRLAGKSALAKGKAIR